MELWKGVISWLWYNFVGHCSYSVNRKMWACLFGIWLRQFVFLKHQYIFKTEHWSPGSRKILHVLSNVWYHQNNFGTFISSRIWRFWELRKLMGQEDQSAFSTCHYRSRFWDCEGLNSLNFFLVWAYPRHEWRDNSNSQICERQITIFGVDLEPILLEAVQHLFKDSKMFCLRAFYNMQKFINVNTHCV